MTARRSLGSALLVLLGALIGIGVDRALLGRRPDLHFRMEAPDSGQEQPTAEWMALAESSNSPSGGDPPLVSATLISPREMERRLRDALRRPPSPERSRAIEEACSLLRPEEMPEALRLLDRLLRREPEWQPVLMELAARWIDADPNAALSWAKDLKGPMVVPFLFGLTGGLARRDPGAAKELLLSMPPWSTRDMVARHFVKAWAGHDLSSAVAWVTELPEGSMKQCAMMEIIEPWTRSDARAAASYFESLLPGNRNQEYLSYLARVWASRDPSEACAWALDLPPGHARSYLLRTVLAAWAEDDPEAASRAVATLESGLFPGDRASAIGYIARAWAEIDIERAASWFQGLPPDTISYDSVRAICAGLAEASPGSAVELVSSLPPGPERNGAVAEIARVWAQRDIAGALAWTEGLSGIERANALGCLIPIWAESDPQAVLAYSRGLAPGETRTAVMGALVPALAYADPEKAAALIDVLPGERDWTASCILNAWAEVDPARAAMWATDLPEGTARKETFPKIAGLWAAYDRAGAEAWLSKLPSGESRDAAIGAFVDNTASQDPGAAAMWAARIEDPSSRTVRMEQVGRTWLRVDGPHARHWIERSPLPDEMKTQLLDPGSEGMDPVSSPR